MSKYLHASWWRMTLKERLNEAKSRAGFSQRIIDKSVEGESFRFFIGDVTGDSWYNNSNNQNAEMRYIKDIFLTRIVKPTIIECGSHHGMTTILLSRWSPEGNIIAFEALPNNVAILKKNLELNKCNNVKVVGKAVGKSKELIQIRDKSNSAVDKNGSITIQSTSIDLYCMEESIKPDIIKIDVEGFEMDVLEGAREVLSTGPAIFIEVHSEIIDRYGHAVDDLWKLVDRSKYEIWIQADDRKPPTPFTGQTLSSRVHLFFRPLSWA